MENFDHAICFCLSFLFSYTQAHKVWLFEKFIFELEIISHNFKINSVLVRQLKFLKKSGVISKIYYFNSCYPICILLILVSASMKIATTSATIIHNNIESGQP